MPWTCEIRPAHDHILPACSLGRAHSARHFGAIGRTRFLSSASARRSLEPKGVPKRRTQRWHKTARSSNGAWAVAGVVLTVSTGMHGDATHARRRHDAPPVAPGDRAALIQTKTRAVRIAVEKTSVGVIRGSSEGPIRITAPLAAGITLSKKNRSACRVVSCREGTDDVPIGLLHRHLWITPQRDDLNRKVHRQRIVSNN